MTGKRIYCYSCSYTCQLKKSLLVAAGVAENCGQPQLTVATRQEQILLCQQVQDKGILFSCFCQTGKTSGFTAMPGFHIGAEQQWVSVGFKLT